MLPLEALSFGLRVSPEAKGNEDDAHEVVGGGEAVEAVFDFGISIGTGAVVVCRSVTFLPPTLERLANVCVDDQTCCHGLTSAMCAEHARSKAAAFL